MIDRPTIERILAAADIVDVVSEFVTLKKAGMNYKGLCPFHDDTTPSFSVSPTRNYCHCFSCGKGGTPVGFIMEHEQMTYPEALRWLAKKYHIEIREKELTSEERQQESERESMFIINEWAAKYYHDILRDNPDGIAVGMQYFRSRGFRDDIIEKFKLGFAIDDRRAMPREAVKKGYNPKFLLATGLCYQRDSNAPAQNMTDNMSQAEREKMAENLVDRYAGRAIFPWIGMSGKVVGFGGRKLDKATKGVQQKYVNSPESVIYHKDHELYGIYQAKKAIAKEDCVYMVEGYTDVISMHQCGIENVVANSGTALSQHQIRILRRLTSNIVLLYDGDAAGIKAAMRGTDMLLEEGMNIKVMLLPENEDPDSFARSHTAEEFKAYIDQHVTDFIQFKIDTMLSGVTDPVKRSEAISSIIRSISYIPDPIIRAAYLQDSAARLQMPEKTLLTRMNRFIHENIEERRRRQKNNDSRTSSTSTAQAQSQGYGPDTQQQGSTSQPAGGPSPAPSATSPEGLSDEELDIIAAQEAMAAEDAAAMDGRQRQNAAGQGHQGTQAAAYGQIAYRPQTMRPSLPGRNAAPPPTRKSVTQLIMESVIRYGEVIIKNLKDEETDTTISLTLAEYVFYNLSADELDLGNQMYMSMLKEIVDHCHDEGFTASTYFLSSPDLNLSRIAADMAQDKYVLSKSFDRKLTPESLLAHIERLLLELRRDYISARLSQIQSKLLTCDTSSAEAASLLKDYQETKTIAAAIARRLGNNISIK